MGNYLLWGWVGYWYKKGSLPFSGAGFSVVPVPDIPSFLSRKSLSLIPSGSHFHSIKMHHSLLLASVFTAVVSASYIIERQDACTVTQYDQIKNAVSTCTNIKLKDIAAPTNSTIDLAKLKDNAVVTFQGKTTFAFTNSSDFSPMIFGGKNVTITSDPGAVIDGNGPLYWDGLGSNGGVPKYVSH